MQMISDYLLRQYARLAIHMGVHVNKGDTVANGDLLITLE